MGDVATYCLSPDWQYPVPIIHMMPSILILLLAGARGTNANFLSEFTGNRYSGLDPSYHQLCLINTLLFQCEKMAYLAVCKMRGGWGEESAQLKSDQ